MKQEPIMHRLISTALLSAAFAFGALSSASAQAVQAVERSGNTFHVAVCPGPAGPGTSRCHAHVVTDRSGNPIARDAAPNITPSGLNPASLRDAYKVTGTGSSSTIIAIVDAFGYNNAESDLAVYRAQFGLPACTTANGCFKKVNQQGVQGNYPKQNTGWAQESALDLEMASAMCPNCKLILVEATTNSFANLAAAVNTAANLGAHVISNSYGGGEGGSATYEPAYNHPGVAVTVSTGDSGFGVQFPASSPHVVAVGGTRLVADGSARHWSETAWSGAGSGCSQVYAKPLWQTDGLCATRMEADVSAVADPATGVAVYGPVFGKFSGWLVFGGTSVAAPLIGGVYGVNGGSVNYGGDPYSHTGALFDVTSGSNGNCGGTYFCTAGAGYDGPTGLGTPNGVTAF
jgi:subtilase family serine protease